MLFQRSMSSIALGLALSATALSTGCHSGGDFGSTKSLEQRRAEFPIVAEDWRKIGYQLDWTGFPEVTGNLPVQFIKAYPDLVVTLEGGSHLTFLEATTGNRRASNQLANPLTKFVALGRDGDRILAISEAEVFTVDHQTGILRSRQKTEKNVATEPVQSGNTLIFGTPSGEVLAHLAVGSVGGVKAWGFATGSAIMHKPVMIGPFVGTVSQAGQVYFLDAQTGALAGSNTIYAGLDTDPVSDGQAMYVASVDQSIYAFAPQGGAVLWRHRTSTPLRSQPAVHGGKLFVSVPGQGLVAFDCANGNIVWTCKNFANGVVVAVNRANLVVFNGEEAALIDAQRGDVIDRAKLPGIAILQPDTFVDGNLYAVSKSGVVAKFLRR